MRGKLTAFLTFFLNSSISKLGVYQSSEDIFYLSWESCFFDDAKGDCGGSDQHFSSIFVPCRCGRYGRNFCGEVRFCIVLWGSDSKWGWSAETELGQFHTHLKYEELNGGRWKDEV